MHAAHGEVCIDAGPSPSLLSSVQNTSVSGNRIECGDVSLASQCRRTFPCDTPLISSFVSARRGLAASTVRYERVYGIVHIKEPKSRSLSGHATLQHVLLDCPGICQLVYNMKASINSLSNSIQQFGDSLTLSISSRYRSLASVSRLTTITTQRSVDL